MKNIILFSLLFSFIFSYSQEKYKNAEVKFTDGISKKGNLQSYNETLKKVIFIEDGKKEIKFDPENILSIEYFSDDKNTPSTLVERKYTANIDKNNNPKRVEKESRLFYKVDIDGLIVYYVLSGNIGTAGDPHGGYTYLTVPETQYFLGRKEDENVYWLYTKISKANIMIGMDKQIKRIIKFVYNDSCPVFVKNIDNEDFKSKDAINKIFELYQASSCSK